MTSETVEGVTVHWAGGVDDIPPHLDLPGWPEVYTVDVGHRHSNDRPIHKDDCCRYIVSAASRADAEKVACQWESRFWPTVEVVTTFDGSGASC